VRVWGHRVPFAGITQSRFQGSMGSQVELILSAEASAPPTAKLAGPASMLRRVTRTVNAPPPPVGWYAGHAQPGAEQALYWPFP